MGCCGSKEITNSDFPLILKNDFGIYQSKDNMYKLFLNDVVYNVKNVITKTNMIFLVICREENITVEFYNIGNLYIMDINNDGNIYRYTLTYVEYKHFINIFMFISKKLFIHK